MQKRKELIPLLVIAASFLYYMFLSPKHHITWVFASGDALDWLTASTLWIVPQPPGSPLYVLLGHLLSVFPGDLVLKMTLLLSVLPGAITVAVVYAVVFKQTKSAFVATISASVLLACGAFLSQATVLEEYSLATMFLALAFYCWQSRRRKLTMLLLGLGTAVHVVVLSIALLWLFVVGRDEARRYVRLLPLFIAVGILPYGYILGLIAWSSAPPFFAGWGLSVTSVREYLSTAGVAGTITVLDFPRRLWDASAIVAWSFGLSLISAVMWLRSSHGPEQRLLLAMTLFPLWYYLTSQDPTTWVYLIFAAPAVATTAGLGLARLSRWHKYVLLCAALGLLIVNGVALNADRLDTASPNARICYQEVMAMPDGAAVLTERGGFDTFTVMYAMSQGKDIVPVFFGNAETSDNYRNYTTWLKSKFGLEGSSDAELVRSAVSQKRPLYLQQQRLEYADGLGVTPLPGQNQYFTPVDGDGR